MTTISITPIEAQALTRLALSTRTEPTISEALISRLKAVSRKPKPESKAARWSRLCEEASAALEELEEMRSEWGDTYDNLSEGLQQGPFGQKCEAMQSLDIQSAIDAVQEADGTDVPLGFGRD